MKILSVIIALVVGYVTIRGVIWLQQNQSPMSGFFGAHFVMWFVSVGLVVWMSFYGRRKRRKRP